MSLLDYKHSFVLDDRSIVVVGPGTLSTIPGIIVYEIAMALSEISKVRRIEVDLGSHSTAGLHRAPSLAAAHGMPHRIQRHRAPRNGQARKRSFRQWIGSDVKLAVAYVWPGNDNGWISEFLQVSKSAGVRTLVLCASLPRSPESRAITLVRDLREADCVVVGETSDASDLVAAFGPFGPEVQTHPALSLIGRRPRMSRRHFTAFLPSDGSEILVAHLAAFDAIPDSRISQYGLRVITRFDRGTAKNIVEKSHHASHVELFGDEMSEDGIRQLCETSSAISMADPKFDSRAFATAVNCGSAAVVLASSKSPLTVGRGYVGGLIADAQRPASIHVAMRHALRLDELGFPSPDSWRELANDVVESQNLDKGTSADLVDSLTCPTV